MTDPFRDDHAYLTELPEELKYRRREAARRRRWRRRLVVAAILAVIGAAAVLAVISIRGASGDERGVKPSTTGRFDDTVITAVRAAGYVGAEAEVPGLATAAHSYILNRIEIQFDDGLPGFVDELRSAGAA